MNYFQLQSYLNQHCRITLRSGKKVFGVLWEELSGTQKNLFFASKVEHQRLLTNPGIYDPAKQAIRFEDIVGVENLKAEGA